MAILSEELNRIDSAGFLDRFEELLEDMAVRYKEKLWNYYLHHQTDALSATEEELRNIFLNPDLYAFTEQSRTAQLESPIRRRLEILMREMRAIQLNAKTELNQCVMALREALAMKSVQVFGKSASVAQVQHFLNQHPDRQKRREAAEALRPALDALNFLWKSLIQTRNRLAQEAGFSDFTAFCLDQMEYRNPIISAPMESEADFTGESYDLFYELAQLNRELNRVVFSPDRTQYAIHQTLDAIGLNPERWALQTVDAGADFPSMCIPVHVPSDIRMFINSGTSFDGFAHLAREYGRACHYAHVQQDHYTLKSVPPVLLGISAELFYRFLVHRETVEAIVDNPSYTTQWPESETIWQKRQQRIFICLSEFEEQIYQLPFEKLDEAWQMICRRHWGFREPAIPDWKIQEWYISRPFMALEQRLCRHYADRIVKQLHEEISCDHWGEFLITRIFSAGNAQPWEKTVEDCLPPSG